MLKGAEPMKQLEAVRQEIYSKDQELQNLPDVNVQATNNISALFI